MKKLFILMLALLLALGAVAYANEATDFIREEGQSPEVLETAGTLSRCDYKFLRHDLATLEWTDGDNVMQVTGDPERLGWLYANMLPLESWDVCRYIMGTRARVSFGARSAKQCETLEEYVGAFTEAFQMTAVYPSLHEEEAPDAGEAPGADVPIDDDTEPEDDTDSETEFDAGDEPEASGEPNYILHTGKKIFHDPSCGDAQRIGPANRQESYDSREELIAQGYSPCDHCNP